MGCKARHPHDSRKQAPKLNNRRRLSLNVADFLSLLFTSCYYPDNNRKGGNMRTATIKLEVRITDLESLIDVARCRDHLAPLDIGEVTTLIPKNGVAAALKAMFHRHPPLPDCEIISINCRAR